MKRTGVLLPKDAGDVISGDVYSEFRELQISKAFQLVPEVPSGAAATPMLCDQISSRTRGNDPMREVENDQGVLIAVED